MIKGFKTIDGEDISCLSINSHKRVIKICDFCQKENETSFKEVYKSRMKRKDKIDLCQHCAIKHAGKIRRSGGLLTGDGYLKQQNDNGERELIHRKVMSEYIKRPLLQSEIVHHIDGIKINNNINNLVLCENNSVHRSLHGNLEVQAFELVRQGLIKFDHKLRSYYICNNLSFEESLGFEQISFKQKKNICKSRLDANTRSEIFRGFFVDVPLIASNMSTVINVGFLKEILTYGAFGFLHRALPEKEYLEQVSLLQKLNWPNIPVSIGIGQSQYELAKKLIHNGANIILIDIAHGYSDEVINLGRKLKKEYPHIKMIVGNTNNIDMMEEVNDFADAVKVGIGQGYACETKNTAGCTEKQFSVCLKFKQISKKLGLPIISDGGTREAADFSKAISAGANSVMAGSIFAACPESAALEKKGKKLYAGMASQYVQEQWKGGLKPGTCSEGGVRYLDIGMPVKNLIEHYQGALRSGITYCGANDIKSMQDKVEYIRLS